MRGRIVKALSGFYYTKSEDGLIYSCRARGRFRKDDLHPLVGDVCDFDIIDEKDLEGSITDILPRRSALSRPPVANLDQAVVVFAVKSPDPSIYLLSKYLVMLEKKRINAVIVFQKSDLDEDGTCSRLSEIFESAGYRVCIISALDGSGVDELRGLLRGHVSTVAGPSGAGKSTLINALCGREIAATGSVSEKTGRGKQTTRHTELIEIEKDTFLFDTPGFSAVDISGVKADELGEFFPEFAEAGDCYFRGCSHRSEPGCAVKEALEKGEIHPARYEAYTMIYNELLGKR